MMIRRLSLILLIAILLSPVAHSAESELRDLARIHQELAQVSKLVRQIEQQVEVKPEARIRFRYASLLERLQSLQHDIQLHIDWVNSQPKTQRFNVK